MQRSILRRSRFVAAIFVAATLIGVSACTSGAESPSPSAPAGGTVTVAGPYPTDSLDPHGTAGAASGTVLAAQSIFSRLVKPTPEGKIVGDLATKWATNADATEWTFTLRKGVKFSDGTPLTPQDIIGSFNSVLGQKGPVAGNFPGLTVSSSAANEITFTAPKPEPALLGKLALFFVTKGDATAESFSSEPVGTGPYVVKSFTPSQTLTLTPNKKYYGKVPVVSKLVIRNIPDVTARLTALQTGEVQATWGIPDDQVAALKADSSLKVSTVPSTSVATMWFNSSRPALQSADVRNALWQAVDFKTIIKSLYPNTGELSKSTVAPNVLGYSVEMAKKYDPKASKVALDKAGFDFSQPLQIQYSDSQYTQLIQAIASDMAKVGVKAVPTQKDSAVFLTDLLAMNWDINFQALSTPTFDAATNLGRLYTCAAKRTGYCNPELDKLLAAAGSTSDTAERKKDYAAANKIIWGEAVGMYPMSLKIAYAWQSKLKGLVADPSFLPDLSTVSY
jgi:peptide/nickel transport system substrate-binding protein